MRVLITGAAGFIGSHIADALDGGIVWGVDNLTTGRRENFPLATGKALIEADICDRDAFYRIANELQPELVIHCAASYSDPNLWHRDTDTNVAGTINATLAARHHGCPLIYFQTALPPISSYAISKIAGEQYIDLSEVPATVFRLANIYGPRNLSGPIPTFYKRLKAGERCTVVDTSRDTVYIADLVSLVLQAIESGTRGRFDVCSGAHHPIRHYYDAVADALGVTDEPVQAPRPDDDVAGMTLDPRPAESVFGWRATTPLPAGVKAAVDWYDTHGVDNTYTHLKLAA